MWHVLYCNEIGLFSVNTEAVGTCAKLTAENTPQQMQFCKVFREK